MLNGCISFLSYIGGSSPQACQYIPLQQFKSQAKGMYIIFKGFYDALLANLALNECCEKEECICLNKLCTF